MSQVTKSMKLFSTLLFALAIVLGIGPARAHESGAKHGHGQIDVHSANGRAVESVEMSGGENEMTGTFVIEGNEVGGR